MLVLTQASRVCHSMIVLGDHLQDLEHSNES